MKRTSRPHSDSRARAPHAHAQAQPPYPPTPLQVQQLATMDMALPSQARFVLDAPTAKETAAAAETIAADAATGAPSVEP